MKRSHVFPVVLFLATAARAAPPLHTLEFNLTSNVAAGSALHVAIDRPDFGGLTTTGAVRFVNTGGNQWLGRVAVRGSVDTTNVVYKRLTRTTSSTTYCTPSNGDLSGASLQAGVPVWNAGAEAKTIYYHSLWTNVMVLYRVGQTETWEFSPPMTRLGEGRTPSEHRYRLQGIGEPGQPLEFVIRGYLNGVEQWDNPTVGGINNNYYTSLDAFFVQDKNIFNYHPPASVSPPQVINVGIWSSDYTANGIPSRGGRIYLPRGYAQNTEKRYPVLYMHDGQNVFDPGGTFGSWSADAAATREITQGRMRETIIVAVNNTSQRMNEYGTPQDGYTGNYYLLYLTDNVKPAIDGSYRTLTGLMDTGVMGSSLGGLISAYIGLSTNVFGLIGAVSPSYWYGPNFRSWIQAQPTLGRRIYQDAGTTEGSSMWDHFWPVYGYYLQDGYAVNGDLRIAIGCGQGHNEAAWANRVPGAFRFLFNPWDEVNSLETNTPPPPPDLLITNPPGDLVVGETTDTIELQGVANPAAWQGLVWSNELTGAHGAAPIAEAWTISGIPLAAGTNLLVVSATNATSTFEVQAQDSATDPAYGGGWANGSDGGTGFGPWTLFATATAGRFIGASGWGLWAQTTHLSEAIRSFDVPLAVGQRFRATLKNYWLLEGQQSVGMALRDAGGVARIQFYFNGGNSHYTVEDALGGRSTGIGWTDQPQVVQVEIDSPTGYVLRVGATVLAGTYEGSLTSVRFWNYSGGVGSSYDFYFDNLQLFRVGSSVVSTSDSVKVTRPLPALHDGIPLSWWNQYGLGTNSSATNNDDADEALNWEEYVADTNPTNALSFLSKRITHAEHGRVATVQVGPPTSSNRIYDLWWTPHLTTGTWTRLHLDRPGDSAGGPVFLSATNEGVTTFYRTQVSLP